MHNDTWDLLLTIAIIWSVPVWVFGTAMWLYGRSRKRHLAEQKALTDRSETDKITNNETD